MDRKEYHKARKNYIKTTHKRVELQLSLKDYEAFEKLAKAEGHKTPNKLIANMAIAYRDTKFHVPASTQNSLNELSLLVRNIANNINQIAHSANIFKEVDSNAVFNHLRDLDNKVTDFVKGKLK